VADSRDHSLGPCDRRKFLCFGRSVRQWLFAKDMLARFERGLGGGIMHAIGKADVHQIDVGVVNDRPPVLEDAGARIQSRKITGLVGIGLHQRHNPSRTA